MLDVLAAIAVFSVMSLPGWLLAADRQRPLWIHIAAGFCSQAAVILFTALIALVLGPQMDVRVSLLVAIVLALAASWVRRKNLVWPVRPERLMCLVPVLATALTIGITLAAISASTSGLTVSAWFNADGFKHLGHVQSLLQLGLPARDIFGGGERLAYYWLFYIIPAASAAWHGNAAGSLVAAGLVQTFAFWMLAYGMLRSTGAGPGWAAALSLIGWLGPDIDGLIALASSQWDFFASATTLNVESALWPLVASSGFLRLSLYIPQHQFMLAGLMSWALLATLDRGQAKLGLRILALTPLVAAGAVSTMFGAACVAVFGLTTLLDGRRSLWRRLGLIAAVGLLALAVPLILGVVDLASASGLDSPIFSAAAPSAGPFGRLLLALPGLILAFAVCGLGLVGIIAEWQQPNRDDQRRRLLEFATAALIVGVLILLMAAIMDNRRLAFEIQLRSSLLVALGLLLGSAWLVRERAAGARPSLHPAIVAFGVPLLVLGLITPVHDIVWHLAPDPRWKISVPADDLAVLAPLDAEAPSDAVVLQYPELPFVSGGRDLWAPVFGGRTAFASHRSTQFGPQADRLEQTTAYFAGSGPLPVGDYDFVYLSRALHPDSFDDLVVNLDQTKQWREVLCRPGACLWQRL